MQLNLAFLDQPDLPPSPSPAASSATAWDQLDEASRIPALTHGDDDPAIATADI
jgi:hypothetical protein